MMKSRKSNYIKLLMLLLVVCFVVCLFFFFMYILFSYLFPLQTLFGYVLLLS